MKEIELKVRVYGDSLLRKKVRPVEEATQAHRDALSQMARFMYSANGIGLAANQVGIDEAMIVMDAGSGLYKLINPKIIKREGLRFMEEGCLSVPGVSIKVKRAKKVRVLAQDEFGKLVTIEAEDLLACVFQHELDHLNGRLIIDYASIIDKLKLKRKLEGLKERAKNEKLPESKTERNRLQL